MSIAEITTFPPELFPAFGLPEVLSGAASTLERMTTAATAGSAQERELLEASARRERERLPRPRRAAPARAPSSLLQDARVRSRTPRTPSRTRCCERGARCRASSRATRCGPGSTRSRRTSASTRSRGGPSACCPPDYAPSTDGGQTAGEPAVESVWVEPYPDEQLAVEDGYAAPEARYEQREGVELAFVAALQHLPPRQRAALILREVLGFSAKETADSLDTTPQSVNSALQRARATVEERLPEQSQQKTLRALGDKQVRAIVERFTDAMQRDDVPAVVSHAREGRGLVDAPDRPPGIAARTSPASWSSGRCRAAGAGATCPRTPTARWPPPRTSGATASRPSSPFALNVLQLRGRAASRKSPRSSTAF